MIEWSQRVPPEGLTRFIADRSVILDLELLVCSEAKTEFLEAVQPTDDPAALAQACFMGGFFAGLKAARGGLA